MNLILKIQLFFCKYFTSYTPAFVASIDSELDYIEVELMNGNRVKISTRQWVIKTINQKVLLERFWNTYFIYQPINDEEYNYLTKYSLWYK